MPTVTIDYYGVEGTGRNVTEAKRDAGERIKRVMRDRKPSVIVHNGRVLIMWQDAHGLNYTIVDASDEGPHRSFSAGGDEESAIRHLLDYDRTTGDLTIPDWYRGDRRALLDDWRRYDAFCRAYRHAEAQGEENPHDWACHHASADQFQS